MTIQIGVNDNNDIFLDEAGNLTMVSNLTACMQACQQAAQAQRGEMQFHLNRGVPNFQVLWNGAPNVAQWRAALREELLLTADVVSVEALNVVLADNEANYTATIKSVFGTGGINV
jgi:hypothetical protein